MNLREGMTTLKGALRAASAPLLDFIYPPRCLHCGEAVTAGDPLCSSCMASMISNPCTREESARTLASLHAPVHAQAMFVGFEYEHEGAVESCLHAMKYRSLHHIGTWFGRLLGEQLAESDWAPRDAVLVPVPLHRVKRIERGYNQAEVLCRGVAMETGWEVLPDALVRTRFTESQAAMKLDLEQRRTNVAGVFRVNEARLEMLRTRPVVLVDDLITTGATIGVCSLVLSERGVRDIMLLAVARPSTLKHLPGATSAAGPSSTPSSDPVP